MEKKMLFLGITFAVLALCATSALALNGPPTAELKQGQWSAGYNYSYLTQDMDGTKSKFNDFSGGALVDSGTDKLEITDWKTQRHYATISYGLADCWEIYGSVGAADVKTDAKWTFDDGDTFSQGMNFDNDIAWGWGTRVTLAKEEKVAWGASLQMNWLDTSWDKRFGTVSDEIDVETWDLLVMGGPTIDMDGWKLYGGPFYYMLDGDWDEKLVDTAVPGDFSKASADLEAESCFGGLIGAIIPLSEACDFTAEASATGDGWGIGAGIALKF